MKQTILVTGASSGFGVLIASKLHESGHTVIGTSRNPEKYQTKLPFKLLALNITDDNSVESFVKQLFSQISQLDVLINNAGYLLAGLAEETPVELGKQQFETNFWGTVKLTKALLPYFRKQKQGKIITTGSFLGLIGHPNVSYYSASKHALEGYFKSLRFELNQFNIRVSMIEPIYFKTSLGENATVSHEEISAYDTFRQKVDVYTSNAIQNAPEPGAVVDTVMKVVNEKKPRFSYPIGKGTSLFLTLQRFAYNAFEGAILKSVNKTKI
ncbi:MAG TPA: SDR family NAD(P)-dependent oxidoreductase [Chitinophagaceae bacterium]|nr:SDR family NAD(P)-dependent oxidoreductase [Chitinophagaceae bacterium]